MNGMDNPQKKIEIETIKPKFYAQTCPNCNGRATVGYDKRPCPTCGNTNHPGIIFVPTGTDGGIYENEDSRN